MIQKIKINKIIGFLGLLALTLSFNSCEQFELPEAGSMADLTPPTASFAASLNGDYLTYKFDNLSASATDYVWDYGDGHTSTDKNGANIYAGEGTYTVTLTASDKLGVSSTYSETIEVVKPPVPVVLLPEILEAGFEDYTLENGTGDGRDSWRTSLGEIMQITSSPVYEGVQAAKFPSDGTRIAYQELEVSANADYVLTYYYTMKTSPAGLITVSVLGGALTDLANAASQTIASYVGTDQTDDSTYVQVDLPFNSGNNTKVAIYVRNESVECRLDAFSIRVAD
ncbi:PKD domain-containing protein [Lutibacter sp.]|uniref:PKD domain-containing protein n=1 Tax=Lutibacter sp. TaxID=1925666 RepID=UPI001A1EF943|nr:PKD domain-containing protein [Lutibacter sp.]MBI9042104.1 PKD domain-containing protein [Lutibacter sp.]